MSFVPSRFRARYVRQLRGGRWQARIWISNHDGHLNLGTYDTAWEAWRVVRRYLNDGILPPGLLPRWVRSHERSDPNDPSRLITTYSAKTTRRGVTLTTTEYATPGEAQAAMRELLRQTFGPNWIRMPLRSGPDRAMILRHLVSVGAVGDGPPRRQRLVAAALGLAHPHNGLNMTLANMVRDGWLLAFNGGRYVERSGYVITPLGMQMYRRLERRHVE